MLPKVCVWTVITFTKKILNFTYALYVTMKNVSWIHFSWATLYMVDS